MKQVLTFSYTSANPESSKSNSLPSLIFFSPASDCSCDIFVELFIFHWLVAPTYLEAVSAAGTQSLCSLAAGQCVRLPRGQRLNMSHLLSAGHGNMCPVINLLGTPSEKFYGIIWEFFSNVSPPPFGYPSLKNVG